MLGLVGSVKDRQSNGAYTKYSNIFDKLDVSKTVKKLDLVKKGQVAGQSNKPSTDSRANDETENRIISIVEEEKDKSYGEAVKWFTAYHDRVKSLGVDVNINKLEKGKKKITTDIRAKLSTLKDSNLYKLQIDIGKKQREMDRFRESNMLTREPRYSNTKIWGMSILFLVWALETLLNGYFFAQGHTLGYVGGITQAAIISLINIILLSWILGWVALRQITHKSLGWKLLGVCSLLCLIVVVPTFNLFVAHYREAFVMQMADPGLAALQTFRASPLQLNDFDSYLLIFMGMGAFFIATYDLWKIYDPFPRYEYLDTRLNGLRELYAENKTHVVEELKDERDDGFDEIQQALVELTSKQEDYRLLTSKMENLKSQLEPHYTRLEQSGRELLAIYRGANELARETPAPTRWQDEFKITAPSTDSFHMPTFYDVSKIVERAQESLPEMMSSINDECSNAIDNLELLGNIDANKPGAVI